MNELGPDARAILAAARDAHDPDDLTRARMRHELLRRVGAGAAVAATVAATATKTSAAPLSGLFAKVVFVAALATGGAVVAQQFIAAAPAPAVAVTPQPVVPAVTQIAPPVMVASTPALAPLEEPPPAPTPIAKPVVASPAKTPPVKESTLGAELQALRDAHVALRDGRPSDALAIVDAMKGSALTEERTATRVLAFCALGRADARAAAERFLEAHPSSPLAPRVRTACSIP